MEKNIAEEQLLEACLSNSPIAQKALYERFSRKMMGVCLRYANSAEEAQDILQDGFIKVFNNLSKFKKEGSLEGWVRRIMVNTALENYRKTKKERQNVDLDNVSYQLEHNDYIIESMEARSLLKLIQTLPSGYKTIFNLYAIEGYTHKEIGVQLDISENTSKSQYSRARTYIQKMIKVESKIAE